MGIERDQDIELRLVDPKTNRFRLYGITECRNLFGELCLRIVWGRIGNRRPRERSEVFANRDALLKRRDELVRQRRLHGYVARATPRAAARERAAAVPSRSQRPAHVLAIASAVAEAHGLALEDPNAHQLVARWRDATTALARYIETKAGAVFDLVDTATLASMFLEGSAVMGGANA